MRKAVFQTKALVCLASFVLLGRPCLEQKQNGSFICSFAETIVVTPAAAVIVHSNVVIQVSFFSQQ
jgi:hypothetical protein